MSKIGKLLRVISTLATQPGRLARVLDDEADCRRKVLTSHPGFADGLPVVHLHQAFPSFAETVRPYSFIDGTSSVLDLALLRLLARRRSDCRFLEIGTWRGESVANVAEISTSCVTVNLPESDMLALGMEPEAVRQIGFFSSRLPNVTLVRSDSLTLDYSRLGKFDLIFIDGDHRERTVRHDTENSFRTLRDEQAVVVWHDYVFPSGEVRYEVLAGILDGTGEEHRKHLRYVFPTMCAVFCRDWDAIPTTRHRHWPVPEAAFEVTIRPQPVPGR